MLITQNLPWPEGKRFAFTIFDDTDLATMQNVPAVYEFLAKQGFLTTKSVWPLAGTQPGEVGGTNCENLDYFRWLLELQSAGFEIGYNMATGHTSPRERTITAIARFEEQFGRPPSVMANHSSCGESIYWGDARLGGLNRILYNVATLWRNRRRYRGHEEADPLFWGDICRDKVTFVRNFVFSDINTLTACPFMPYHDPSRPYVNYWYGSSDGANIASFNRCLSEANQDRLEEEGGACIMATRFGAGFVESGKLDRRFKALMQRLSGKPGWFVPAGRLLDFLLLVNGGRIITSRERRRLERTWLRQR